MTPEYHLTTHSVLSPPRERAWAAFLACGARAARICSFTRPSIADSVLGRGSNFSAGEFPTHPPPSTCLPHTSSIRFETALDLLRCGGRDLRCHPRSVPPPRVRGEGPAGHLPAVQEVAGLHSLPNLRASHVWDGWKRLFEGKQHGSPKRFQHQNVTLNEFQPGLGVGGCLFEPFPSLTSKAWLCWAQCLSVDGIDYASCCAIKTATNTVFYGVLGSPIDEINCHNFF